MRLNLCCVRVVQTEYKHQLTAQCQPQSPLEGEGLSLYTQIGCHQEFHRLTLALTPGSAAVVRHHHQQPSKHILALSAPPLAGTLHQCSHGPPVIDQISATCGIRLSPLSCCLPSFSAAFPALLQPSPAPKATFASHWQDSLHASPQPVPTSQHHQALPPSTAPNAGPRPRRRRVLGPARLMACPSPWLCLVLVRVPVAKPRIK